MTMETRYDALIAGAGLAGSALACVLAGLGWRVALLDPGSGPKHKVCGEFLSPEAGATLRRLGLNRLVEGLRPVPVNSARFITASGAALDLPFPHAGMGISRFRLDQALREHAVSLGVDYRDQTAVTGLEESKVGWEVRIGRTGDRTEASLPSLRSRCVFAAWGRSGGSFLRKDGESPVSTSSSPFMGIKTHLEWISPLPVVELYFVQGGYLGLSSVEDGRVNASALVTRSFFRESGGTIQGALELMRNRCASLAQRLAGSRLVPGTQAAVSPVPTNRKLVPWSSVPHIGDAAAVIPPLCGDGMSMALRSVEHAAALTHRCLLDEINRKEWQMQYTEAILRDFTWPVRWGRLLQTALSQPHIGNVLLGAGRRWPGLALHAFHATRIRP